ncbi:hypothetical protein R3P38DRAFT_3335904 [Favolaschia claudopus]|uniref:Uncharacterized protein n=1 Tax=Favolaschia claudopus TaxID=2862362 RepID=A0AAV9Z6T0_9AGAR
MPEYDIANALEHEVSKALRSEAKISKTWPEGHLEFFPRSFTIGTSVKSYTTLTADRGDYQESQEPLPNLRFYENEWDIARVPNEADWAYLAHHQLDSGPVHVAVRGKNLAFTADFATIIPMTVTDYRLLTAPWNCVPGPNEDPDKAELMRSFNLPYKFREPGARTMEKLTVNVDLGRSHKLAIVFTDFSRLLRLHVISKFGAEDLVPRSQLWNTRLWSAFPGGPDWVRELPEALASLDEWQKKVLNAGKRKKKCIVDLLTDADGPGGGIGKHLANDFLYEVAIHPDTPSFALCSNEALFSRLRAHLPIFMARWTSSKFLTACAGSTNSLNPFAFNTTSHRNFISSYVPVYRRTSVRVPRDLYNFYLKEGLFDPDHIIGAPCHEMPVRFFVASNTNRYHIIRARVPAGWPDRGEVG